MNIQIITFKKDEKYRLQTVNLIRDLHLLKRKIYTQNLMLVNRKTNKVLIHNYILNN